MRPHILPYVLEIYSSGENIEFAEAMVAVCKTEEATALLWEIALDPETKPLVRTICLAHLLNRDQLTVWTVITERDIETIANSMPAHVVHWKTLLLKYTGRSNAAFKNDTYPERHKFKALLRECAQIYINKERRRQELKRGLLSE